jgi:hypothetical protein
MLHGAELILVPNACDIEQNRSRNQLLVEADDREGVYIAEFPIDRLREYRVDEVWGNAYRKTRTYGGLTENVVAEPFVRSDRKDG